MTHSLPPALTQLAQLLAPGSTLVRAWPLVGGVSAQVTALQLALPDGTVAHFVVRQHGAADRARNPAIATDEYRLLDWLSAAGLPVPQPRFLDAQGALLGSPALVVDFVEGTTGLPAAGDPLPEFAAALARLHALDAAPRELAFLGRHADAVAARVAGTDLPRHALPLAGRLLGALRAVWPPAQRNKPALLHGDFWPGNTLWRAATLAAIIDWEDAALGDPLADLANSRLEILWARGESAMQRFTALYLDRRPLDCGALPVWELVAALRPARNLATWGLPPDDEQCMRAQLEDFAAQALARCVPT